MILSGFVLNLFYRMILFVEYYFVCDCVYSREWVGCSCQMTMHTWLRRVVTIISELLEERNIHLPTAWIKTRELILYNLEQLILVWNGSFEIGFVSNRKSVRRVSVYPPANSNQFGLVVHDYYTNHLIEADSSNSTYNSTSNEIETARN